MIFETNKDKGRAGLAFGVAYFGANGYTVNMPLNDTQWYDFIAEKDGQFFTVQCKATGSKDNTIQLESRGGTNGGKYDSILNHKLDYLFCLDAQQNMFVIPYKDLLASKNTKSITLRIEKSKYANTNSFDTSCYLVKL